MANTRKNEGKKRKPNIDWSILGTSCIDLWLVDRGDGRRLWRQLYINLVLNQCDGCQIKIIPFRWCVCFVFWVGLLFGIASSPISMPKHWLFDLTPRKYWKIWHSFHYVTACSSTQRTCQKHFFFIKFISWGLPLSMLISSIYNILVELETGFSSAAGLD